MAEDDASSLDALLGKYGSSGRERSVKLAASGESSADDDRFGHQEEPSSQFLLEIRERAKILSRNAAKSRKAALQNVVSEGSQSTSEGASLDLFMDIIRSTAIPEETVAPLTSSVPPSNEEDLAPYTGDDLLQPVVPLDTVPWNATEDDSLNTSQSYYQGSDVKPWGESAAEVCDDANEDSDSSSEESSDSNCSDVDGAGSGTTSMHTADDPPPEMDEFGSKSDLGTDEADDDRGVEDSQHVGNQPIWQAEAVKDTGIASPKTGEEDAARKDEENSDRDGDEDEEGDDCCNDEVDAEESTRCLADVDDQSSGQSKPIQDVSPIGSTTISRDESASEEEDKMKNSLSIRQPDLTPDVCLLGRNTDPSACNINSESSVNRPDGEATEDQPSQLFEVSEDDELDATAVQQRVSSALDDILGEVFNEEGIPRKGKGDSGESSLRAMSPVLRLEEDSQGELQSLDKTSCEREEPCGTRLSQKTKSSPSQQMGHHLERGGVEDGNHLSSDSLLPSKSLSSRNHSEEKTAEYFCKKSTEMESRDGTDFVQVKVTNLPNQQGQKVGPIASNHSLRSDEATVEQSGCSEIAEPHHIDHSSSETKDPTGKVDLRDQSRENVITLTVGSLPLPQLEADASIRREDAVCTAEEQTVISKSGRAHVKESFIATSCSQDKLKPDTACDAGTKKSDRPPILLGETKKPHKLERKWGPRIDDPSSSPQTSQAANHRHKQNVGDKTTRYRSWGPSGPRVSSKPPPSPDAVTHRRDGTLQDAEDLPKGPGNVRGLIARFNCGSACSSPVDSPRGERVQAFDWNTFPLRGKLKTAGRTTSTGIPNCHEKTHASEQNRNSSDESSVNCQDVPWLQELRERKKKRREQGVAQGEAPP